MRKAKGPDQTSQLGLLCPLAESLDTVNTIGNTVEPQWLEYCWDHGN